MRRVRSVRRSSFIDGSISFILVLLLLGALGAKGTASSSSKKAKPETADTGQLAAQNTRLRKQLDLASGETFYYTLDPTRRLLRFMYQGNLLVERKLLDVEVGTRRGFLGKGSAPSDWAERVWGSGELDPPRHVKRHELDAGSEDFMSQREVIGVPPTPEEAYPAPPVWWIRYSGGLAVEVHGLTDSTKTRPGFWKGMGQRFNDAMKALTASHHDAVRIRIYLSRADADVLYRSVPPDTRFTILPVS